MFFIVVHHGIHALNLYSNVPLEGTDLVIAHLMDSFCLVGVNVFVLISGWFGIRPNKKSFLRFYLMCAFYAGVLYLIDLYARGSHINRWCLYNTIFPISHNPGWWFVPCYLMLYLLSPLLNKAIDNMGRKEMLMVLAVLMIINVYFGFYRQMGVNKNGYNLNNFIFLYFIGRILSRSGISKNKRIRVYAGGGFVIGSLILGTLWLLNETCWHSINPFLLCVEYYNHPLLIVNSVALLLLFSGISFHSRLVNWMASSSFAVYLIQDNNLWVGKTWYKLLGNTPPPNNQCNVFIFIALASIFTLLVGILIDKPRKYLTDVVLNKLIKE